VVSREVHGRHVCILRMLCVLSSLPVAPVLPAGLLVVDFAALPEVAALDAQNLSPVVTTFRGCELLNGKYGLEVII
jgi:hypothetical protein